MVARSVFYSLILVFISLSLNAGEAFAANINKEKFLKVFETRKCDTCHSLKSYGVVKQESVDEYEDEDEEEIEAPDLSTLSPEILNSKQGAKEYLKKYLKKKIFKKNKSGVEKKHNKYFKGNTDEFKIIIMTLIELSKTKK